MEKYESRIDTKKERKKDSRRKKSDQKAKAETSRALFRNFARPKKNFGPPPTAPFPPNGIGVGIGRENKIF